MGEDMECGWCGSGEEEEWGGGGGSGDDDSWGGGGRGEEELGRGGGGSSGSLSVLPLAEEEQRESVFTGSVR